MILDPYADFARRYDRFFDEFGQHDPAYEAFFRSLFDKYQVHKILDCACGTGHDLHLFKTLGCEVYGSDVSEAMLAQARENLSSHGLDIPLQRVDFRELPQHFNMRFDAVACLSTSLPHLLEEAQIIRALTSIRAVLRDQGILVLTQGMCDKQLRERPRYIPVLNSRDFSRVFVMEYARETLQIDILDLLHTEGEQVFDVASVTYRVMLRDDYERLLSQAGFAGRHYYGNYLSEPYDKEHSNRLIVVAQR
jgi:SAM-dependent methyltransferase